MSNEELEGRLIELIKTDGGSGGMLLIFHEPINRCRLLSATLNGNKSNKEVADILDKVAAHVRDGDGMPLGRHMQTIEPTEQ